MSDYVDLVDYYNYDIYDEDPYNDDEFGDQFNVNEYGEGSSHPIPRHNSGWRRLVAEAILHIHNQTYMAKEPCHTSAFTGAKWIAELNVGHPNRMYQAFHMSKTNFLALCQLLESRYGLREAERISCKSKWLYFYGLLGNELTIEVHKSVSNVRGRRFQGVSIMYLMPSTERLRPWPWPREEVHKKIRESKRYFPHFEGAIDGTHIKAHPNPNDIAKWIGRKGYPTQNIMAACDFDMCFIFALSGWEGSAHDTRIFYDCIPRPIIFPIHNKVSPTFIFLPNNSEFHTYGRKTFKGLQLKMYNTASEYYLVDVGYPNIRGFLAPYKGCMYHVPDWRRGRQPRNNFECFNKIHSSLRCTIEKTFGVWKVRWPLICDMPVGYSMETQKGLVTATMTIHNFIRRSNMSDIPFGFCNTRPKFMPYDRGVETTTANGAHGETCQHDDREMNHVRTQIRDHIVANRIR
ncbi:hypothetical protein Vadar_013345 [Vaccinium darrowii]|uniref:Uncharacterized protein n=1 Tax=Vaccinium darrowii TaxID=229202 RepID=A0ACB7YDM4_9ERIC|nr:hypothetical protein Vadar_013345 [Vaccinium darrowii]